jgi:trimeric autotransporter adhesin
MSSVAPAPAQEQEPSTSKQTPPRSGKPSSARNKAPEPSSSNPAEATAAAVSAVATNRTSEDKDAPSTTAAAVFGSTTMAAPSSDDDAILQSISQRQSVLMQPLVTLTLYIPSPCVGAVIGRRGQTIAHVQRLAGQVSSTPHPVRVSVIGGDSGPVDPATLPYTYSELDFTDPAWTPVVIRADPKAAFTAAAKLEEIVDANDSAMDDVVLDVPLSRQKHSAVVGKRGLVLASLSADAQVRIMVPNKDRRHDVVQLEGSLSNVKMCLERLLLVASKAPSSTAAGVGSGSGAAAAAAAASSTTTSALSPGGTATTLHSQTIVVAQVPSQTKIRGLSRKTDTVIKKKKVADSAGTPSSDGNGNGGGSWQLTVTGSNPDKVQSAIQALQKSSSAAAAAAVTNATSETGSASVDPPASSSSAPAATTPKRGKNRGRGGGANKGSSAAGAAAAAAKRRGSGANNTTKGDPSAPAPSAAAATPAAPA